MTETNHEAEDRLARTQLEVAVVSVLNDWPLIWTASSSAPGAGRPSSRLLEFDRELATPFARRVAAAVERLRFVEPALYRAVRARWLAPPAERRPIIRTERRRLPSGTLVSTRIPYAGWRFPAEVDPLLVRAAVVAIARLADRPLASGRFCYTRRIGGDPAQKQVARIAA